VFVIIGAVVVLLSILGGFCPGGGPFLVLMQVAEFIIIGGAATGALLISTPPRIMKKIVNRLIGSLKGNNKITKETYLQLLALLYELFKRHPQRRPGCPGSAY